MDYDLMQADQQLMQDTAESLCLVQQICSAPLHKGQVQQNISCMYAVIPVLSPPACKLES